MQESLLKLNEVVVSAYKKGEAVNEMLWLAPVHFLWKRQVVIPEG